MLYFFWVMALCAGLFLGGQSAINSQLSTSLGQQPILAALISFAVGTVVLLVLAKSFGQLQFSSIANMPLQPWWQFIGGFLGAFVVFTTVLLAPKLGIANMLLLILIGQLISGMLIDHFGWLNMPLRPVSLSKIIGLLLMIFGLVVFFYGDALMKRFGG
ncbi:MAG: DMT family transporter [Neisseria sp.]|nr:DMT family transporter [Neisseria sp.]